jgi:MFS family permease
VTNRSFLVLCLMYGSQAYGWYFNITYLPQFMERQYHVLPGSLIGAIYKGGPLWMGAIGSLLGGIITDAIVRRTGDRRLGRRLCGWVGHSLTVLCFIACLFAPNATAFFVAVSLAAFLTDLAVPSAWACCQDIGGRYAAIVGAFMNTVAGLSGALAGWVTGSVLEGAIAARAAGLGLGPDNLDAAETTAALLSGYHINFCIFAALYVVAFLCWFQIDPDHHIVSPDASNGPVS